MPITASTAYKHVNLSTNNLFASPAKHNSNSFISFFRCIFNSSINLKKIGVIIDTPVNKEKLSKELNLTASISSVKPLNETDRNRINTWVGTSEIYTNDIPQNTSPYIDMDTKELLTALHKMPNRKGVLYRVGEAPGFINGKINVGDVVVTKRLLSFSSSLEFVKGFAPGRKVFFVLDSTTSAYDISKLNPQAAESVVDINSMFNVKNVITTSKGNTVIHLTENTSQLGYRNAKDMYTGESFLLK